MSNLLRLVLLVVGIALVVMLYLAATGDQTYRITQAELQDTINDRVPQLKPIAGKKLMVTYNLLVKAVGIELLGNNRLRLAVELTGQVAERPISTSMALTGLPRYDDGKLYFEPEGELELLSFDLTTRGIGEQKDLIGSLISGVARVTNRPEEAIEAVGANVVQSAVKEVVPMALARVPVYDLHKLGAKGTFAASALEAIRVEGDVLVLQFSLEKFLGFLSIFALMALALAMVFVVLVWWGYWVAE